MRSVQVYDTTLRDGTQAEEFNLTCDDKLRIARKLDALGIHYIEGGWPGSNPTDKHFFERIRLTHLVRAKVAAFGSTHHPKTRAEDDHNLQALMQSGATVATIFGKTWDFHVEKALGIPLERNLKLIESSIRYLKPHFESVFFDAEHFFDGFLANPDYAIECVKRALAGGADLVVPCDTNGGRLPSEVAEILKRLKSEIGDAPFGIHCHNDCDLAVANTLVAVELGASQVQGTINGYGERCGNANLSSIIPCLELKMGIPVIGAKRLARLTETAQYVTEVANLRPFLRQPFVGRAAFAHKGGIHVSAVLKHPETYEHIRPEAVGNKQRVLLSDLAGRSNIIFKARQCGLELDKDEQRLAGLLDCIKKREAMGFEYSVADASFELLLHHFLNKTKDYFTFHNFFVMDAKREADNQPLSEATVIVSVHGREEHTAATGSGPVNALDRALRKGLEVFYPRLKEVRLTDFKVRVISGALRDTGGTASYVRVFVESSDQHDRWTTVGVSQNIIEASWQAVVDSVVYKLFKDDQEVAGTRPRRNSPDVLAASED